MKPFLKSNLFYLLVLTSCTFLIIMITDHYILTFGFYKKSGELGANIMEDESKLYISLQKWIYICSFLMLLLKLALITLIIKTALFLLEIELAFNKILRVVILSEFIFLIPALIKIIFFLIRYPSCNIDDWNNLAILSLLNIVSVPPDWQYLCQTLNIFEIGYWFLLAHGICKNTGLSYDRSVQVILFSYVPSLLIWIAAVTFCSLVYFPFNA